MSGACWREGGVSLWKTNRLWSAAVKWEVSRREQRVHVSVCSRGGLNESVCAHVVSECRYFTSLLIGGVSWAEGDFLLNAGWLGCGCAATLERWWGCPDKKKILSLRSERRLLKTQSSFRRAEVWFQKLLKFTSPPFLGKDNAVFVESWNHVHNSNLFLTCEQRDDDQMTSFCFYCLSKSVPFCFMLALLKRKTQR